MRQPQPTEREAKIDALGDPQCVLESARVVGEELGHLGRRLQIELGVIDHLQTIRGVDRLTALDADHHVLSLGVLGRHIVDIVRDHKRDPGAPRNLAHALVHALLLGDPVFHELEVVVPLAEDLSVLQRDRTGRLDPLVLDRSRELALKARGQGDESRAPFAEQLLVHSRPVVIALEVGRRHEGDEILIAGEVLREEHQVEGLSVSLDPRVTVEAAVARDVRLDTHDGFDARVAAERVEVDRSVERAVIGERERGHPERFRARHQIGEAGQPVEQAVLAVRVKVDELLGDSLPHACARRKPRRQSSLAAREAHRYRLTGVPGASRSPPARDGPTPRGPSPSAHSRR